jgi:hypothetical protein
VLFFSRILRILRGRDGARPATAHQLVCRSARMNEDDR